MDDFGGVHLASCPTLQAARPAPNPTITDHKGQPIEVGDAVRLVKGTSAKGIVTLVGARARVAWPGFNMTHDGARLEVIPNE
jgi:hypothetical protein